MVPHYTGRNKADPEFGVASLAPLFGTVHTDETHSRIHNKDNLISCQTPTGARVRMLSDQLVVWDPMVAPKNRKQDTVMACGSPSYAPGEYYTRPLSRSSTTTTPRSPPGEQWSNRQLSHLMKSWRDPHNGSFLDAKPGLRFINNRKGSHMADVATLRARFDSPSANTPIETSRRHGSRPCAKGTFRFQHQACSQRTGRSPLLPTLSTSRLETWQRSSHRCHPSTATPLPRWTSGQRKRADKRTRIANWYLEASRLSTAMFTGADSYLTYGFLPFRIEANLTQSRPTSMWSPQSGIPRTGQVGNVVAYAKRWLMPAGQLAAQYPSSGGSWWAMVTGIGS